MTILEITKVVCLGHLLGTLCLLTLFLVSEAITMREYGNLLLLQVTIVLIVILVQTFKVRINQHE